MATSTINELVKSATYTVTTNSNGISAIQLPVATATVIAVIPNNSNYFATMRPFYNGYWYVVLETYAGARVPNTEITLTVRYI